MTALLFAATLVVLSSERARQSREPHAQSPAVIGTPQADPLAGTPVDNDVARSAAHAGTESVHSGRASVRILTRTASDEIAPAVSLFVMDDGKAGRGLGDTDAAGELRVNATEVSGLVLVGRGGPWRPTELDLGESVPDQVVLRMQRGESLLGRVIDPDGTPIAGARVVAWPATAFGLESSVDLGERVVHGDPRLCVGTSAADGSFEVAGVAPRTKYALTAARAGALSNGRPVTAWPGESVSLTVAPAFAVLVRYVRAGGEEARVSPSFLLTGSTLRLEGPGQLYSGPRLALRMAGIPSAWLRLEASSRHLYVATGPADRDRLGPLRVAPVELPGYEPLAVETDLFPLSEGLRVVDVPVVSTASGRGEIRVLFSNLPNGLRTGPLVVGYAGSLKLTRNGNEVVVCRIDDLASGEARIGDVPYGTYETMFVASGGMFVYPPPAERPLVVEVGPDPAVLEIDTGQLAGVQFALSANGESPYHGSLSALLIQGDVRLPGQTGVGHQVDLAGPPYVVFGLPSGDYTLRVYHPPIVTGGSSLSTFTVRRGEVTRVPLVLSER